MFFDLQERGTVTEPPPRATYSANVTQWEIYDAYQEDFQKQVYISLVLFFLFESVQIFLFMLSFDIFMHIILFHYWIDLLLRVYNFSKIT